MTLLTRISNYFQKVLGDIDKIISSKSNNKKNEIQKIKNAVLLDRQFMIDGFNKQQKIKYDMKYIDYCTKNYVAKNKKSNKWTWCSCFSNKNTIEPLKIKR